MSINASVEIMYEQVLDLNACCAEFCSQAGHENLLAIGTYQLDESSQTRVGRLYISELERPSDDIALGHEAALDTSGIFNMRWTPGDWHLGSNPKLALANSAGEISLVERNLGDDKASANEVVSKSMFEGSMAVSLAISSQHKQRLVSTSANGQIAVLQASSQGLDLEAQWVGHDLEAWTCCFHHCQAEVMYTGGDDCAFKGWDMRQGHNLPTFSNRKEHTAGVTSMNCSPYRENVLVTGSYDEKVRMWDTRSIGHPMLEASVGGGVWNLKWHPSDPTYLLAACMHNGFAVMQYTDDKLSVAYDYPKQKTLGYGADWCHHKDYPVVATTSFYDRLLHIWKPEIALFKS